MILVDTSIWVDHFRNGSRSLERWLLEGMVARHDFVLEELALGQLKNRVEILRLLESLPEIPVLSHEEYLYLVGEHQLFGKGLGLVDIHLLGAAMASKSGIATLDKALSRTAKALGILVH